MRIRLAVQVALGVALMVCPAAAPTQIYILVNDAGKTIIVPSGQSDPEAFILAKMTGKEGMNWRIERVETRKGCLARRSITAFNKPTRWAIAFAPTTKEAEQAAIDEARAITGVNKVTPGNWEQGYCNKASATARTLDVPAIERQFLKGR